ncbi:MAG: amidohydrolase family protein, partial [Eudoraea sp.]|nr:amidohydrolase family protein [Eudoraea sp.]
FNNIYQMMMNDAILDSEALGYINPLIKKVDSKNQFDRWYNTKQVDSGVVGRIKKQHDFHLNIISKLHNAGIPIICGTDAGIGVTIPGFSIHKELAFYKEAGLSNYEVLKTATVNASQTHSIMNQLGTIEKGKIANLLIVDDNPLTELSSLENPSSVFVKGRILNRETLDSFEEKARNRKNLIASALRYLENLIIER